MHIALNDLRMQKPVLLIDELPWHELNPTGELTVQCTDPYLREVETYLRQMLYRQRHIPGDMVLPQELKVSKVIHSSGIGISVKEDIAVSDAANRIVSHRFIDQMKDESCMELLHNEEITLDEKKTTTTTGVADFSSIKNDTNKNAHHYDWLIYVGYALIGLSVLGILYFIIATAVQRKADKQYEYRESSYEAPRTSRFADEATYRPRKASAKADTDEVYVPRRARHAK